MNPSTYEKLSDERFRRTNPTTWFEANSAELTKLHQMGYRFLSIGLEETESGSKRTLECTDQDAFLDRFCETEEQKVFLRQYTLALDVTHHSGVDGEERTCRLRAIPIDKGSEVDDGEVYEVDDFELFAFYIEPAGKDGGITDVTSGGAYYSRGLVRADWLEFQDIEAIADHFIPAR